MDLSDPDLIRFGPFYALVLGIVTYFAGVRLSRRFGVLRAYSIPDPVSGGLLAALLALGVALATGREIAFDLFARDVLLVYFFTTVGMNARLADLAKGGPLLALMLVLTVGFMAVQTVIGAVGAFAGGLPWGAGVALGTGSMVGGHGTAIAWGPTLQDVHGVTGAVELGVAAATMGLIMASLLGGPIARFLIERRALAAPGPDGAPHAPEAADVATARDPITNEGFMNSVLWMHLAIFVGFAAHEALDETGVKLPLFVPCMLSGILLANVVPPLLPRLRWPGGTASLALIAEFSLSVFLSMSLMSMALWTLAGSAGALMITMALQAAAAVAFIVLVVFPAMGRNYVAAVLSAGFAGFSLGATPTAIANMNAVARRYGPAPLAFIVLPLVSAFFVDIVNAALIKLYLSF